MDNGSSGVPQFEMPHQPNQSGGNVLPQNPNYAPQPAAPEMLPPAGNQPGAPMPQMMHQHMTVQPPAHQPQMPIPPLGQQPRMRPPSTAHLAAQDSDLIEKEWVEKAKEIVERTRHDPFLQNREITKMKADYMKKRYNKDIRIPED
jgi:hypothetical protein